MSSSEIEDIVGSDYTVSYSMYVWPVMSFFWKHKICKTIRPGLLLGIYLGMGAIYWQSKPSLLSRVVLALGILPVLGVTIFVAACIYFFKNFRKEPLQEAQDLLKQRIAKGRAERITKTDGVSYDLYLPKHQISRHDNKNRNHQVGVLFFPGASVHHGAYAPIASALSDKGFLVAIVSLEPIRFVSDLETNLKLASQTMEGTTADFVVDEWVLAGHSAGAMSALTLAAETNITATAPVRKLVVCGVGRNEMRNGTETLRDKTVEVLVINGGEDRLVNSVSKAQAEAFREFLPPKTTRVIIEGGDHAGFGHYPPQSVGDRTISLENQQRVFVENTVQFLLEGGSSSNQ